jgi:hypothetical protein
MANETKWTHSVVTSSAFEINVPGLNVRLRQRDGGFDPYVWIRGIDGLVPTQPTPEAALEAVRAHLRAYAKSIEENIQLLDTLGPPAAPTQNGAAS